MTQRSKPVPPRARRSSSDRSSRRTLYLNIAFLVIILVGTATLVGAAVASYAGAHWAEVANVNGVSINHDTAAAAADVATFKLTYEISQLRNELSAGRISQADFDSQNSNLSQEEQNIPGTIVDSLADDELQRQLAQQAGIAVTDQQVDAQILTDATVPELRHVLVMTVTPVDSGGGTLTDADKAAARGRAEAAYGELLRGAAFAKVAGEFSTDGNVSAGGDIGWVSQAGAGEDPNLVAALFALPASGGLTSLITGTDGSYLIGQVVATSPTSVDTSYSQRLKDAGISTDAYRAATRAQLTDQALSAKITSDAISVASVQREVSEIKIDTSSYTGPGPQVRARHILYTPGNADPSSSSPSPSSDPAWAIAQSEAQVAYAKLKAVQGTAAEATEFAAIAQTDSKDTGSATDGGLLPYYDAGSGLDPAFSKAIFATGLKAGDLLPPVASQFGWHVILIDSIRPAPADRAAALQKQAAVAGTDFGALAKANSDASDAGTGGDMGWIARDQIAVEQENAIFAAPVGSVSQVITLSDGLYIFKVVQEQTRLPDPDQVAILKDSAFSNWYATQKAKASITGPNITPSSTAP